ncbi:protein GLUTELIN PRECURSOR ACCUMULATION 3-like isoform X2 [Quercus suber]|uniref:protein GLUTELIN PRECURSOR ACCUMULATION 3-like isoform X2 n=1 Tax=Quercus suber TaxID=58331 RepID=UPI0032DF698B
MGETSYRNYCFICSCLLINCVSFWQLVSAQWKRLPTGNEPPAARAYHSMTSIGSRHLLIGGFDGKSTFGDLWWLVPEEDPIAKRFTASPPNDIPENKDVAIANNNVQSALEGSQREQSAVSELQRRLEISVSLSSPGFPIVDELEDKEFLELASSLSGERVSSNLQAIEALRDHWRKAIPRSIPLKEFGPLLRDYQRLIARHQFDRANDGSDLHSAEVGLLGKDAYRFYHIKNASQVLEALFK